MNLHAANPGDGAVQLHEIIPVELVGPPEIMDGVGGGFPCSLHGGHCERVGSTRPPIHLCYCVSLSVDTGRIVEHIST